MVNKFDKMENKLLNRMEIKFSIRHNGKATPSRKDVMDLIKKEEPKSNPEHIVIKHTNTRFGQPLTTGLAYIYGDAESMKVEPEYIHKRHEVFRAAKAEPAAEKAEDPAPEESASEEPAPDEGGDE